jgi:acyl-CoA synthetase (AMP-forming)/AMP-acid ligase II
MRREVHYGGRIVKCYANRPPTIDAMFRRTVASSPSRTAIVTETSRINYRDLDRTVDCVAGNLSGLGFAKGDRIALLVGNRPEFLIVVLAAARLGLIVVPVNTRQARTENEYMLSQCRAKGVVYDAAFAPNLPPRARLPSLDTLIVIGEEAEGTPFGRLMQMATSPAIAVDAEDVFCLLYTSGTTGRPKGARLTHLGAIHSVLNYRHGMVLVDGDVSVLAVPASHVTGLVAILLTMIGVAGCSVIMPEFKARRFLEIASAERMTHALMVPAMYNLCLLDPAFDTFDLAAWRVGGFGGAPMPEATIQRLAKALPELILLNIYGATETTSPATMMPRGAIGTHFDTVGRVLPCAEVIVMDDDGREVGPGETGELWIAGPMVVPGYWDNAEADATSFIGGFWKSGDIGSIDADGYVRVLDRKKDVINRGGYKIYSIEVENVLAQHPAVLESAIVSKPDRVLGELVHAFVVLERPGVSIADLKAHCAEALADYKVPTSFTVLNSPLPRNANGKVLKRALLARSAQ